MFNKIFQSHEMPLVIVQTMADHLLLSVLPKEGASHFIHPR